MLRVYNYPNKYERIDKDILEYIKKLKWDQIGDSFITHIERVLEPYCVIPIDFVNVHRENEKMKKVIVSIDNNEKIFTYHVFKN